MIDKTKIEETIDRIKEHYDNAPTEMSIFYSKLVLLELCGWIEESMDDIARRYATRKIGEPIFINMHSGIVSRTHGFLWKRHFRPMLCSTVGIYHLEKIHECLQHNQLSIDRLRNELHKLWKLRGQAAHTHTIDMTPKYPTPDYCKSSLKMIYDILLQIDIAVSQL